LGGISICVLPIDNGEVGNSRKCAGIVGDESQIEGARLTRELEGGD
jgi:hypothetical protein